MLNAVPFAWYVDDFVWSYLFFSKHASSVHSEEATHRLDEPAQREQGTTTIDTYLYCQATGCCPEHLRSVPHITLWKKNGHK